MIYNINIDAEELVMFAGEEAGETTAAGTQSNVFTFGQPQMSTSDMLMNAGIVILVVFGVLFIMYVLISLAGKILATATKGGDKPEAKPAVAAAPAAAAPAAAEEEFSSGTLKLKGCDEKTAAMIMAIVADDTGIPLSELVFKSIKLVEKK
jgi:Na+-transporting methylmalonyl-CoA/oxaloacetate decarboxylase gamma subunit